MNAMKPTRDGLYVVSGGGTGMGREIALRLAATGKQVLIVGRREAPLRETARMAAQGTIRCLAADLGTPEGAARVRAEIGADTPVAGIVAAAGGQGDFKQGGKTLEEVDAAWTTALRKNLFSSLLLIEGLLAQLRDGQGRVILISSTSALDGRGGPYATAKAAMHGYMMDLCQRLAPRGITVNVIAPGYVRDTDFFAAGGYDNPAEMERQVAARLPLKRVGVPGDIAGCAMWLLGEDGGWTTGQVISVNGGAIIG